jgi:outer membrane lipoprotein carrier protein
MFVVIGICDAQAQAGAESERTLPPLLLRSLADLSELNGFSGRFEQVLSFSDGTKQRYGGRLDVLRPKKFRWHYLTPYEQLYVSNGSVIWLYEPDLLQAQRLDDIDAVDPVVVRLLDGRVGIDDVRLISDETDGAIKRYQVQIGESPAVWLGIRKDAGLQYVESLDALGNRNRIIFREISRVAPQNKVFRFTPPEGIDVIGTVSGSVATEK